MRENRNPKAIPSYPINWKFEITVDVNGDNVLEPHWFRHGAGLQDGFPAYELYIIDSDGKDGDELGTIIYQYDPIPLGLDPSSLEDGVDDVTIYPDTGRIE